MRARGWRMAAGAVPLAGGCLLACGSRSGLDTPVVEVAVIHGLDAGVDASQSGLENIDPVCSAGGGPTVYPPYVPLVPPTNLPANCANGFWIGDATAGSVYTVDSLAPMGASASTLDIDFATYKQPDGVVITGTLAGGTTYTLLDSCRLQTSDNGDMTNGEFRPADDTIRQFRVNVQAGTVSLSFDFGGVVSPMYIQALGLCAFDLTSFSANAVTWQLVP